MANSQEPQNIPALSDTYHKARRSYGFFAGLFLAWELVGVSFGEKPFGSYNVTLKSSEAVPYVLFLLLLYFAFRTTIEWFQCDTERRSTAVSRIDFWSSHSIALLSLIVFFIQIYTGEQIAVNIYSAIGLVMILFYHLIMLTIALYFRNLRKKSLSKLPTEKELFKEYNKIRLIIKKYHMKIVSINFIILSVYVSISIVASKFIDMLNIFIYLNIFLIIISSFVLFILSSNITRKYIKNVEMAFQGIFTKP